MTHLTFDEISELAENAEPAGEAAEHLARCDECRETWRRVRALVEAASALPHDVTPPGDAWIGVRDRVRAEHAPSRRWSQPWLAVAAVLLVVLVGTLASTLRNRPANGTEAVSPLAARHPAPAVPAVQAVDRNYTLTIGELRATLATQRSQLAPSTLRTVERALTVIDSAIAEARAALAADPANAALVDILSAHYERKVDLLQRAAELSSL
jgi:predicted anti-sigma-YlaC factor YlaD